MKVLAVASQKGGAGKSTISIHLAVQAQRSGIDTLLADLDPHSQTSSEWGLERQVETPTVVRCAAEDVKQLVEQARAEGFGLVILDLPPYVAQVTRVATQLADYTLIPAQPRFGDIRTLPRVLEAVHPPATVVLNACPPGIAGFESSKTHQARATLEAAGIPVAPVIVTRREAYADALNGGESVMEYDVAGKAAREMIDLYEWLKAEAGL